MRPGQPLEAAGVVIGAGGSGHFDHLRHVAAGLSSSITVAPPSDILTAQTNTQARRFEKF
jgi:hypothetical protein